MEKNPRVKPAHAWAVQGWVTPGKEGCQGEKNYCVMGG